VFQFSARIGGAYTLDRAIFGANMASSTGIGLFFNAGSSNAGSVFFKGKVANHIDENLDATFTHQNNWIKTFFIGGENLGDFADVPTARKDEFRQLILRLKPTETVAYLLIDYV
jgi:hypothetical protein